MNFFGGPSTIAVKASAKLKQLEEENEDAMFVIISDLWLDNVEVLEKIQTMFSGLMHFSKASDCTNPIIFPNALNLLLSFSIYQQIFVPVAGYSAMPPTCFIFCGNFSSAPYGKSQIKSLKGEKL